MKREDLEKQGLTKEQIDYVMAEHGQDIEAQKAKTVQAEAAAKTSAEQLAEANKQIDAFKGMDIDGVKKTAEEYKKKFEDSQVEHSAKLAELEFNRQYDTALSSAKPKYANEIKAKLKLDELRDKDGMFITERFNEQIKTIKEASPDLFESDKPNPTIITGGTGNPIPTDAVIAAARAGAGLPPTK